MYKEMIEQIARFLVEKPDAVRVNEIDGESTVLLELHVDDSDRGRVIGKEGRVVNALRSILKAAAARRGDKRVELEVIDKA